MLFLEGKSVFIKSKDKEYHPAFLNNLYVHVYQIQIFLKILLLLKIDNPHTFSSQIFLTGFIWGG